MKINFKKRNIWLMASLHFVLTLISLSQGNIVTCFANDCHVDIPCERQPHPFMLGDDSCWGSCLYAPQLSESYPGECFCCSEIPLLAYYIYENKPLSRHVDPSCSIPNLLAYSLPDDRLLLNKPSFSPLPTPHIISTQKALRSVILII